MFPEILFGASLVSGEEMGGRNTHFLALVLEIRTQILRAIGHELIWSDNFYPNIPPISNPHVLFRVNSTVYEKHLLWKSRS